MSIIKPVKSVPRQPRGRALHNAEAEQSEKLSRKEIGIVASSGLAGLVVLFLIAWLLLPISSKIVPFVVVSALPLFTLLAIIYQAVVYRRQWNVMQRSLKQTDNVITKMQHQLIAVRDQTEVMKKALIESEKQTANTEASVIITQNGIEHAQRAYVTIIKRELSHAAFVLTVENSGNTPAREVAIDAIVKPDFGTLKMPEEGITNNYRPLGLLAPHGQEVVVFEFGANLSEEDLTYYNDPQWGFHWYCKGYIMYRDIFQHDIGDYWVINFCFYFDQLKQVVKADSSGNEMEEYRNGKQVRGKQKYGNRN